jgi:hypothetical protein
MFCWAQGFVFLVEKFRFWALRSSFEKPKRFVYVCEALRATLSIRLSSLSSLLSQSFMVDGAQVQLKASPEFGSVRIQSPGVFLSIPVAGLHLKYRFMVEVNSEISLQSNDRHLFNVISSAAFSSSASAKSDLFDLTSKGLENLNFKISACSRATKL